MQLGLFMMPNHPPRRGYADAHAHDLDTLGFADRMGFVEGWVGEHFTARREPVPCPDILIAQAFTLTRNIRLGAGAFLLPYHVPAELAARISYLDHISGGRFMAGIGAGGLPTDWELFGVDGASGQHRAMMNEAIDLMVKLWTSTGPFEHHGKYYKGGRAAGMPELGLQFHLQPLTKPHPTIAIAGLNEYSPTLKFAGKRGFTPMSLAWSPDYLLTHWQAYRDGCEAAGRPARLSDWRVGCETYIAETDSEARRRAISGEIGESWRTYLLPMLKEWGMLGACKHDQSVADSDVTVDYLVDKVWMVGSPRTVTEKLGAMRDKVGQFGCLLQVIYDHLDEFDAYRWSLTALAEEVAPAFATSRAEAAE
jgi:alkanesulfonate monooxygenase SsuD/methylene tetrahydromethanopterin reductase-like flavin-dependent oxidoreductase (luciferase family)